MSCYHFDIENWGTPQARCHICGTSFDPTKGADSKALDAVIRHLEYRRGLLDNAISTMKALIALNAGVAQSVERGSSIPDVASSSLAACSTAHKPGCAILSAAGNPACSCGAGRTGTAHE